jgi:serine protease Do
MFRILEHLSQQRGFKFSRGFDVLTIKKNGFVAGATLGLVIAGGAIAWGAGRGNAVNSQPSLGAAAPPGAPDSFANIVQRVAPAVVSIDITGHAGPSEVAMLGGSDNGPGGQGIPGFPFPFNFGFEDGQGGGQSPSPRQRPTFQAAGSGFFISSNGYIVTNNHVVKDAETITVRTSDKRVFKAHLIGRDPTTDLAVIKVDGASFPYVTFEDSSKPRVGDWVVAVGNPFGLGGTATAGIVSALGRENIADSSLIDYMQIDAPINRGNSGGPTFDVYGRVVGVNTMIYSPSGGSVGIGFDIPANVAGSITRQLIANGKVSHGYIGATIQEITPDLAESLGLKVTDGALIADLTPGGPAARSGLEAGDVVMAVNGHTVTSASDLTRQVAFSHPGDRLHLAVLRNGRQVEIDLRAGLRPAETVLAQNSAGGDEQDGGGGAIAGQSAPVLGMRLAELDAAERQQLNLGPGAHGVAVQSVDPTSDAGQKGLQQGDVIVRAGDRAASRPSDIAAAVADARASRRKDVLLMVNRDGRNIFVPVAVSGLG